MNDDQNRPHNDFDRPDSDIVQPENNDPTFEDNSYDLELTSDDYSGDVYDEMDGDTDGSYNRGDYDNQSDVLADDSEVDNEVDNTTETKKSNKQQRYKLTTFLGPILFALVLLVNYLSSSGEFFPNTQSEITDRYTDLLSPAGFTFSIWSVIYIGVAITLASKFINSKNPEFVAEYKKIQPLNWLWMILNIAWIFTFAYEQLALSTFLIVLYTLTLGYLSYKVTSTPVLNENPLLLKWPIGLHFGWLIVATFPNLTTFLVSVGLDGTGMAGVIWAVVAMMVSMFEMMIPFSSSI